MTIITNDGTPTPAWATDTTISDEGLPCELHIFTRQMSAQATMHQAPDTEAFPAKFELSGTSANSELELYLAGEDISFRSPAQARAFADALKSASHEWEHIAGENR